MPDRRRRPRPAAPTRPELPAEPVRTSTTTAQLRWDGPQQVTLLLEGTEASGIDLADPGQVPFEYMQQMLVVLDAVRPGGSPVRALHLGGAGCALARTIDARRPGSSQLAVELDGELARLVREWFDLPRSPRLRIRVGDARAVLSTAAEAGWEVVVRDVFAGAEVPPHVRTVEMAEQVRRALPGGGLYLVNLTDRPPLARARQEVATLQEVFEHVVVVVDPAILRGRRYGNVVLAASPAALPVGDVDRALRRLPLPVRLVAGAELEGFVGTVSPWRDLDVSTHAEGSAPAGGTDPSP